MDATRKPAAIDDTSQSVAGCLNGTMSLAVPKCDWVCFACISSLSRADILYFIFPTAIHPCIHLFMIGLVEWNTTISPKRLIGHGKTFGSSFTSLREPFDAVESA